MGDTQDVTDTADLLFRYGTSHDSRGYVELDGQDISRFVRTVTVRSGAQGVPLVTLELVPGSVVVDIDKAVYDSLRLLFKRGK